MEIRGHQKCVALLKPTYEEELVVKRINESWYDLGRVGEKFFPEFRQQAENILRAEGLSGHLSATILMEDLPGQWGHELQNIMKNALDSLQKTFGTGDPELEYAIKNMDAMRFLLGQLPDGGRCLGVVLLSGMRKPWWKFW